MTRPLHPHNVALKFEQMKITKGFEVARRRERERVDGERWRPAVDGGDREKPNKREKVEVVL